MRTFQAALALGIGAGLVACSSDQHLDVTIHWSDTKQTIDGFGASSAFFGESITDAVADQLFDAKKGIGLSLLRTMIGLPADTQDDGSEPADGAVPVATAPGLTTALQASLRGAKVWATAWTPPPIWKTTNNKNGSGTGYTSNKLDPAHYQDYASYLADFVDLMATRAAVLPPCCRNRPKAALRTCPSGSSAAAPEVSTPMRRICSPCCARAASGQVAEEPKMPPMNSRRLIVAPEAQDAACYTYNFGRLEATGNVRFG